MSCCCCFWVGGEMQTPRYAYWTNSVIYIPMDDQGASHARLLPGNRGERDKKEGKREKKLMLLPKWEGRLCIEDTVKYHCCGLFLAFTPPPPLLPNATLFWDFLFLTTWVTDTRFVLSKGITIEQTLCCAWMLLAVFPLAKALPLLPWHQIIHY